MLPDSANDALNKALVGGLTLIAFCFPIAIAISSLSFFPTLALYVLGAHWTFKRWPPTWGRVEKAFVAFWGISLLSALASGAPRQSVSQLSEDLYFVLIPMLGGLLINDSAQRARLMHVFMWGGLVSALFGILQFLIGINQDGIHGMGVFLNVPAVLTDWPQALIRKLSLNDGRATGLRSHPLMFAESLLFSLAYLLSQRAHGFKERLWASLLKIGILGGALLLSKSRGPWIAFSMMIGVLALLEPRKHVWRVGSVVLGGLILLVVCVPSFRQRARSIADLQYLPNAERLMMWRAGAQMVKDHPLLGVGPGRVRRVSPQYQTAEQNQAFGTWGHLHNTFVHIAAERGLVGFGAFLFLLGTIFSIIGKAYRQARAEPGEDRILLLTALLAGVGWGLSGLTEAVYNSSAIQMLFYFVMGMALAAARSKDYCKT